MDKKELMSPEEENRLKELEAIIKQDLKGFIRIGMALKEVKDSHLYRGQYTTWKDYLKAVWDMGIRIAEYQVKAFEIVENLKKDTHNCAYSKNGEADSDIIDVLPRNEAQVRPLAILPPVQQITAWEQVLKRTNGKVTALAVSKVVEEILDIKREEETILLKKQVNMSEGLTDDFIEFYGLGIDILDKHEATGWKTLKRKKALFAMERLVERLKSPNQRSGQ